jgi:hypothetical protein
MGMVALHFKLPYAVYGTNSSAPIFFILLARSFSFFTLLVCFIYIFILHHGSHQETCLHKSYKAKAPSAKATASRVCLQPDKAPHKKSTSIKHTSSSKPSIAATMDMSISSDSSLSSTDGDYYAILPDVSDFFPTSLLTGHGTIPIDVKDLCQIAVLSPS